ncbi:hypothetical protein PG985_006301 [Apiospora marii]|uniref:Uncharacterized protein n=1 Tax=Apiospora marii TaxID=335849 RepID=A0ABR1S8J8_9PEZI
MKIANLLLHMEGASIVSALGYSNCNMSDYVLWMEYHLEGGSVLDIAERCNRLWGNLDHGVCPPTATYCGGDQTTNILGWHFRTEQFCGGSEVAYTWNLVMSDISDYVDCNWK